MPYLKTVVGHEEWSDFIIAGLQQQAVVLAAGARVIRFTGKALHVPVAAAASTAWLAELEEISEDSSAPSELVLAPYKVANISVASTEAVTDASADVLDAIGEQAIRAIALAADRAMLVGTGTRNGAGTQVEPVGLFELVASDRTNRPDNYAGLVTAANPIRAAGGNPNAVFISAADYLTLITDTDGDDRPLLSPAGDTTAAPAVTLAGMRLWPTPALTRGNAIVADMSQVLVGIREDARVDISTDAAFGSDAVLVRTVARLDIDLADRNALVVIEPSS